MRKLFVLSILLSLPTFLIGQLTVDETVAYMNQKLNQFSESEKIEVEFKRKKFLTLTFEKNGDVVREDKIYAYLLDPESIEYVASERMIQVRCKEDKNGRKECVDRNLIEKGFRRPYNRMTFDVGTKEDDIEGFIKALTHFINFANDPKYETNETLD